MSEEDLIPDLEFPEETPDAPVVAEPEPEVKAEAPQETQMVPLAALQSERASARSLRERLDRIEGLLTQPRPAPLPDVIEQPEAYQQAILQQIAAREANIIAEVSERLTRGKFGDETVDEALEAAKASGVVAQFANRRDGWGDLVKWHKSQKALTEIGDDPAAYAARVREQARQEVLAEMTAQSVKTPLASPSLAGQPNLGARTVQWTGPTPIDDILGNKGF